MVICNVNTSHVWIMWIGEDWRSYFKVLSNSSKSTLASHLSDNFTDNYAMQHADTVKNLCSVLLLMKLKNYKLGKSYPYPSVIPNDS